MRSAMPTWRKVPFTPEEDRLLREAEQASPRPSIKAVAEQLGRSPGSVSTRRTYLGLSTPRGPRPQHHGRYA